MTTLAEIRAKFPQYADLDDKTLLDGLHKKYYADMPRYEFDRKVGAVKSIADANPIYDAARQVVYGINQGLSYGAKMPGALVAGAADLLGAPKEFADKFRLKNSVTEFLESGEAPRTTAGRYANKMGQAVGASALPTAGLVGSARALASIPVQGTMSGIAQNIGQQVAAAPATAAAFDVASAASGGAAVQAAEDAGLPDWAQTTAGIIGGMAPGVVAAYRNPSNQPLGTPTGQRIADSRLAEAVADAAAFDRQEVRPFGPSFNQGIVAGTAKQLTETLPGAPLRNNLDETYSDAAQALGRFADNLAPNVTAEQVGANVQQGLGRFRESGIGDIDPGTLNNLGIQAYAPNQPPPLMSNAAAARAAQAGPIAQQIGANTAQTTRGVQVPPARPMQQTLLARRHAQDLSDQELQTVIRAPAADTSFGVRQEALYERAFRSVPTLFRRDGSADPGMFATPNAASVANGMVRAEQAARVQSGVLDGRFGQLVNDLRNARSNFTLQALRDARTELGRALGNMDQFDSRMDRSQLAALYRGVSQDIELALQDVANRAVIGTQGQQYFGGPGQQPVTVDQARRAQQALRDFRVADRYTRLGMERMDAFMNVLRAQSPEQAVRNLVQAGMSGSRGNAQMLRAAITSLRPEERNGMASLVVREMGTPVNSARGAAQEFDFSPSSFVTRYRALDPDARNLLFTQDHQQALDDLFRVANRVANVEALANSSRSATNAMNIGGAGAALASFSVGDVVTPLVVGGGGYATSLLMSRPAWTRWMVRYLQLRSAVSRGTDRSIAPLVRHITGLEQRARQTPELWPVYEAIVRDNEQYLNGRDAGRTPPASR